MKVVNITSEEIMMLRLSAACVDSVKDAIQFADSLRAPTSAASPGEAVSPENAAKARAPDASVRVPASKAHSKDGCVTGHIESEPGQMFKILNSTGLGLACYTSWSDAAERVDLASTAQTTDLTFQPQAGMVYLPDLARKVCSEQYCIVLLLCAQLTMSPLDAFVDAVCGMHAAAMWCFWSPTGALAVQVLSRVVSLQLESSFIGSIRSIDQVVVDKVGLYAYPLRTHGRQQLYSWSTFQNALVVSVRLEHRTKIVHVHTPYRLVNKCPLLLRFKVRITATIEDTQLYTETVVL